MRYNWKTSKAVYDVLKKIRLTDSISPAALAEKLGRNSSSLSTQLATLRNKKLIKFRREGKSRIYSVNYSRLFKLAGTTEEEMKKILINETHFECSLNIAFISSVNIEELIEFVSPKETIEESKTEPISHSPEEFMKKTLKPQYAELIRLRLENEKLKKQLEKKQ